MTEPVNNPSDHKHDDYGIAIGMVMFIGLLAFVLVVAVLIWGLDEADPRLDRLEEQVCAMADDPAACLRDLLEDRR